MIEIESMDGKIKRFGDSVLKTSEAARVTYLRHMTDAAESPIFIGK